MWLKEKYWLPHYPEPIAPPYPDGFFAKENRQLKPHRCILLKDTFRFPTAAAARGMSVVDAGERVDGDRQAHSVRWRCPHLFKLVERARRRR